MNLENTKTLENLKAAFAGESQARNKYSYYASVAKKEGYVQIANIFEETAGNEKEHAKIWYKLINGGSLPDTYTNLINAANGENEEWTSMYEEFATVAKEEGLNEIATLFEEVGKIEKEHEERFRALASRIKEETVFNRETTVSWKCLNCGHIHTSTDALDVCPVCNHPRSFFEVKSENY